MRSDPAAAVGDGSGSRTDDDLVVLSAYQPARQSRSTFDGVIRHVLTISVIPCLLSKVSNG